MFKYTKQFLYCLAFLLIVVPLTTYAGDDDQEWKGLVESRPSGLVGTWVIGGQSFEANNSTQFEEEHGALNVGVCAEVKYNGNIALKIESQEAQECGGGDDDDGGDNDDDGDDEDNDLKVYGYLDSFPSGLIGEWVVDGVTYTANASTEFEQEHGSFAVGICVEIEYLPASNQAQEIQSEYNYKCDGTGGGDGTGNSYSQLDGVIESYPAGLVGTWVINGASYTTDANTRFEQEDGPFFVGGCVEMKYIASSSRAVEIESEVSSDCAGQDGQNSAEKFYGLIESIPDGLIGTWSIGGTNFESSASTEFEQENGSFAVGVCAEVTYSATNGSNNASKIESTESYHCTGGSSTNEVYGTVETFPSGLYGTWVIAGQNYVASPSTQFEQEHGSFAVGACVKVKYYTENGVKQASKIESKGSTCGGGDDDGSDHGTNKVYATIDSLPASPYVGTWAIGGVTYDATATTQFEQEHGTFAVGVCVEAKYSNSGGTNTLVEVESEHAYKCGSDGSSQFTAYGVVESIPSTADWTGTWQIGGVSYQADASTTFEQAYGFFAVGAYVEVKYEMSGQTAMARSIETHVAPNNGLDKQFGKLESYDTNDDWNDWVINGVTYKADPAIDVGTGNQAPQIGQTVFINSYSNSGTRYLTSVNGTVQIFLPAVTR